MQKTKIPWVINPDGSQGYTWNPIVGCSPASEGCAHCYAAAMSHRFGRPWGSPMFMPDRLDQPGRVKKPSRIFVCSMSDLFHEEAEVGWQLDIMKVVRTCPRHTFILLTKRPDIMAFFFDVGRGVPDNCWIGVTAENQAWYDERVLVLTSIRAKVRFVSVEPMLSRVAMGSGPYPDWVIAGPENGAGARPCNPAWIDDLAFACAAEGVPFFDKRPGAALRQMPEGYLTTGGAS